MEVSLSDESTSANDGTESVEGDGSSEVVESVVEESLEDSTSGDEVK